MTKTKKALVSLGVMLSTVFGLFMNCNEVNAESYSGQAIWPSESIANIYIKKDRSDGYTKYQQARFIRRSEDNRFVYCLQPYADIDNNYVYQVARSDYEIYLNMTKEQFQRINLYAYYGYGYGNHQDHKWYAITQVLIWRTADPSSQIYFTDTLNGSRNDSIFASEMAELEAMVNSHYATPQFDGINDVKLPLTKSITLNDKNNKLGEYKVVGQENISASINGNSLTLTATGIGNASVTLTKTDTRFTIPPIVYFSNYSQNVFRLGAYDPLTVKFNLEVIGGKVAIEKVDSDTLTNVAQGNATLKGAVYGIFTENGTKIAEITTDANGYAKSDYLPSIGKLYVQELKSSQGYKLDPNKYYVDVTSNNLEPTIQVKEEVIEGKIKINKVDSETNACKAQGEATLVGAKYKVLNSKGEVVDTLTIGEDCSATSKNLPYGNYKVVEEKSSVGYYIDNTQYNVSINEEKTFSVTSKENVIKGKIKVTKVDSENNSCTPQGQAVLKGAIYEILDLKGNVVDTITIDENCSATSKYLPYGRYKIKEKTSSKGYYLDTNIYSANIVENNIINVTSKEQVIKNYISILKQYDYVDGTTQFLNAESNITFEIYYPNGNKFGEVTTDKNGYATLDIPYGVWKFHQVNTTTGFEKIYDFYITVDENSNLKQYYNVLNNKISAYLQVFKTDSETGKTIALADTTFKILNVDTNQYVSQYVGGKVYDEFKTDETGKFITYLKLEAGNYKLIEISSPSGYLIDKNGLPFSIGNDTHYNYTTYGAFVTVYFKDAPIKGQVEVNKTGEKFVVNNGTIKYEEIKLDGVVFNVYADEDIKTSDGQHIYYNKGDLVDIITTDANGYAISKKLPLGKYYLVETKTKDDHVLIDKKYYFELTEENNTTAIVYDLYTAHNSLKKGDLEFTKTDLVDGEVIPNVEISIYTEKDELVFNGKTDSNGKIVIKDLYIGKYYLIEKNPATGYILNDEKIFFEIKNNEIVKAHMTNKKITSTLKLTKENEDKEKLVGVVFGIYDLEGNLLSSHVTNEEGIIEVELEYGSYYYQEMATLEGYVLSDEKQYFDVTVDGMVIHNTIVNEKITSILKIYKTDENSKPLANVVIGIYDLEGNLLSSHTTNEEGIIEVELEYGSYYYQEISTLESYILSTEKEYFDVTSDGEIIEKILINELEEIEVPNTLAETYVTVVSAILIVGGSLMIIIYNLKRKRD